MDYQFQIKAIGEKWELGFDISEAQNTEMIRAIGLRGYMTWDPSLWEKARFESKKFWNPNRETNHVHWFKRVRSDP
jgi:hypothetical protein